MSTWVDSPLTISKDNMKFLEVITGEYIATGIHAEWRYGSKFAAFALVFVYLGTMAQAPFTLFNIIKG